MFLFWLRHELQLNLKWGDFDEVEISNISTISWPRIKHSDSLCAHSNQNSWCCKWMSFIPPIARKMGGVGGPIPTSSKNKSILVRLTSMSFKFCWSIIFQATQSAAFWKAWWSLPPFLLFGIVWTPISWRIFRHVNCPTIPTWGLSWNYPREIIDVIHSSHPLRW